MEYLAVRFPRSRRIKIDGKFSGRTDDLIELEAGTYTVSLGPPANFSPESQQVILSKTSVLDPREVRFDPL